MTTRKWWRRLEVGENPRGHPCRCGSGEPWKYVQITHNGSHLYGDISGALVMGGPSDARIVYESSCCERCARKRAKKFGIPMPEGSVS